MPIIEKLTTLAHSMQGDPEGQALVKEAADYIETLRRQLLEAHSFNQDSERVDWLQSHCHLEHSDVSHRKYFVLPRVLARRDGKNASDLRQAIDMVRNHHGPHDPD